MSATEGYSHGMLGVSGPERAKADSESGETEYDEDASIKLSIPAITIVLLIKYYRRSKKYNIMIHDRIVKLSSDQ